MMKKDHYRLAPPHSHNYEVLSSITLGHSHKLRTFVFPVNGSSTDGHYHTFKGITKADAGHHHHFEGITGPAVPLPDGSHYHRIIGRTKQQPLIHQGNYEIPASYPMHDHDYQGSTGIGIGYEPDWW